MIREYIRRETRIHHAHDSEHGFDEELSRNTNQRFAEFVTREDSVDAYRLFKSSLDHVLKRTFLTAKICIEPSHRSPRRTRRRVAISKSAKTLTFEHWRLKLKRDVVVVRHLSLRDFTSRVGRRGHVDRSLRPRTHG